MLANIVGQYAPRFVGEHSSMGESTESVNAGGEIERNPLLPLSMMNQQQIERLMKSCLLRKKVLQSL